MTIHPLNPSLPSARWPLARLPWLALTSLMFALTALSACGEDPAPPPKPECTSGATCPSGVCTANTCQPATCMDGVRNGSETGVDCGGTCAKCSDGQGCRVNSDCSNSLCRMNVCVGKKEAGQDCSAGDECDSGICRAPGRGLTPICTVACTDSCAVGNNFQCFRGYCVPPSTCEDPDRDGVGVGPGCADSICSRCGQNADCQQIDDFSYECACKSGYKGDGITCANYDECAAGVAACGPQATCMDLPGTFMCVCDPGYKDDGQGGCEDVDECAEGVNSCDPRAQCINTFGSFACACPPDLFDKNGDGTECVGTNECLMGTNNCDVNADCTDTPQSFTCACRPGYIDVSPAQNGTACSNIDECSAGLSNCSTNATCADTPGGFTCTCRPGFTGDGVTCVAQSGVCATQSPCGAGATCIDSAQAPGYRCICANGFKLNAAGTACEDIDECATPNGNNCDAQATCRNTVGSFTCTCDAGYAGNGVTCQDIDECASPMTNTCNRNATCTNTVGDYTCACNAPFIGDGRTCRSPRSCQELLQTWPQTPSGVYTINTGMGGNLQVYCDMTTSGGGYTMLKINHGTAISAAQAEQQCQQRGMHLFIPRSRDHLASALDVASNANIGPDGSTRYLRILGIYPNARGATCLNRAFKSGVAGCSWRARDNGPFFVSERVDITEPNGDNEPGSSMYYAWESGAVVWYNDIPAPGYTSERFMCDVQDKQ